MFLAPIINPLLLIKPAHYYSTLIKNEFLEKRDPVAIRPLPNIWPNFPSENWSKLSGLDNWDVRPWLSVTYTVVSTRRADALEIEAATLMDMFYF